MGGFHILKNLLFYSSLFLLLAPLSPSFGQEIPSSQEIVLLNEKECETLVRLNETKNIKDVYTLCGFSDKEKAEGKWERFARKYKLGKALFRLCQRDPENDITFLNCEKSADLNYRPALLFMGDKEFQNGYYEKALALYKKAFENADTLKKGFVLTEEDEAVAQAAYKLSILYLKKDFKSYDASKALSYLKASAALGYKNAEKALGVIYSLGLENEKQDIIKAQELLFKAALKGCPLAEEALALPLQIKAKKIEKEELSHKLGQDLFLCSLNALTTTRALSEQPFSRQLTKEECACNSLRELYLQDRQKPYRLMSLSGQSAELLSPLGQIFKVERETVLPSGFVVDEIRKNAIILRRETDRLILVKKENEACFNTCFENLGQVQADPTYAYRLSFTPYECRQIAFYADKFMPISESFVGLKECHFEEAKIWQDYFKEKGYAKLLYLQGNIDGDYPLSKLQKAKDLYQEDYKKNVVKISDLLVESSKVVPKEKDTYFAKAEAYCTKALMHMEGAFKDDALAFEWNKQGFLLGYPQSINLLGIQYARGQGVTKDLDFAKQLFKKAGELSPVPFLEAEKNFMLLSDEKEDTALDSLSYGKCSSVKKQEVLTPSKVKEIEKVYQPIFNK